jgi:hypothetical protein
MMSIVLPVLMAVSSVNAVPAQPKQQKAAVDTIKCPLDGQQIHPCCCPLNK